ncbi:hypothetical protein VDG1235_314 [Verrucomicrobiia bacterium DG1235]|nr:hypothetical protein VDG1235_314 [Verrucomicrobiae bacterium DG1235]
MGIKDIIDLIKDLVKSKIGRWALSMAAGGAIASMLSIAMALDLKGAATWAIFGIAIGVSQWMNLPEFRNRETNALELHTRGASWILFSGLAWSVMPAIDLGPFLTSAIPAFAVGASQGILLSKTRKHALLWVPTNILAWIVGTIAGLGIAGRMNEAGLYGIDFVAGIACASITGAFILWGGLANMPLKTNKKEDIKSVNQLKA